MRGRAELLDVLLLVPAFRNMDAALEEVSRTSGAGTIGTLWRIVVPILAPTILAVMLLGIIRSMQAFEVELILGTPAHERFPGRPDVADLLVPIHVRKNDLELWLFCTYMTLGTPQDVTLQELRIETFFPADEASERTWRERFA